MRPHNPLPPTANDSDSDPEALPRTLSAPEQRLRDLVALGDEAAAEEFVHLHLDDLYEFVHYRVGGDRGLAEDVVQDTFIVALERMGGFEGNSSLHTWLCGIARNKLRTHRRKRRPLPLEDVLLEADADIDRILSDIEHSPLPDWALERQETQDLVGATLSSLTQEYRAALVGKYMDGTSVRAIAEHLGKGEKAAESTLQRARVAFSKVFTMLSAKRGGLEQ
ncbi:MAG: RNA polymerase sigma-70 factor (ECF subfamily) [Gammaproteobacteria bacterium]|jgi:RNA polymerase sigma-70 factor (ECF subfamily)